MARGKWPFGGQTGQPNAQQQGAAKAASALVITTADGKKFGFENYCNNCYVNSVVQALYFCAPFRDLMLQSPDASIVQAVAEPTQPAGAGTQVATPATSPPLPVSPRRKPERKPSIIPASEPNTSTNGAVCSPTTGSPIPPTPPSLFSALRSLFYHISTHPNERGTVVPKAFIDKLKEINQVFNNTSHQDAHEFLNYLLNRIVEEVEEERKNEVHTQSSTPPPEDLSNSLATLNSNSGRSLHEATIVHKLFEGVLTSETRCLTCESVSSRDESFLDLSIDIEQNSSVTACLRSFSASEMLCNKNKFFCDSCCDLQEAEKRMKINRLPNILALHLKRFKYQEETGRYIKLSYRVAFPFELRLFNTVDDVEDGDRDRLYQLFGIVVHIGAGPNSGHYVSIIKTMGTWLLFDDETVTPISEADIPMYYGESPKGSAYVLYYQAVDIDMAKLGLRKEVEAESAVMTEIEREKRREGLGLRVGNGALPPPPGLEALDSQPPATNGSTTPETAPVNAPITPKLTPHPLPPVPSTPSHHGRNSTDTDYTHASTHVSTVTTATSLATTPASSAKISTMQSIFGGLHKMKRTPSSSHKPGAASILNPVSASSPNVTVTPAPPAPPIVGTMSEPTSASVSVAPPLPPLEAVKSDPISAQHPPHPPPANTGSVPTPRITNRPLPLPNLETPAQHHPADANTVSISLPTAPDLQRSDSQRSPARPQTSPGLKGPRTPRPLPIAPGESDPPPAPPRPVTSEGLDNGFRVANEPKEKGDHRQSINAGLHPPEVKKDKESKKGWLRRSLKLPGGDKSKSSSTTQQQVEAGLVPPSPSLATRGLTVPGVLNITADDNSNTASPASVTSSGSPLKGLIPLPPQQRRVSAPDTSDTIKGHQRTPSADRPPSAYSHSSIVNGHSGRPSPSPASSTLESNPFTDESSSKPPTPHSHTHSRSRSALPQPPIGQVVQNDYHVPSTPPAVSARPQASRTVPVPLPPVPGSATIPHQIPPTPQSPDFTTGSPHTAPFSIRVPARKPSVAVANEAARSPGPLSSSPERKRSLPSFPHFRHKDKGAKAKEKAGESGPHPNTGGNRSSVEQHPAQSSSRASEDRPLPPVPAPKVVPEQHVAYSKQPNGVPAVLLNGSQQTNGHAQPPLFPIHDQQSLKPYTQNGITEVYATEARDQVPSTLGRRQTVATSPVHAPQLASANSHSGSAASSIASSGLNLKKATRKLSFSVGFGKKDKEKEKEKKVATQNLSPSAFTWSA